TSRSLRVISMCWGSDGNHPVLSRSRYSSTRRACTSDRSANGEVSAAWTLRPWYSRMSPLTAWPGRVLVVMARRPERRAMALPVRDLIRLAAAIADGLDYADFLRIGRGLFR